MKINLRYLPKRLTKKDKMKQIKMLKKSRRLYKKGIYFTRKKVSSFKTQKSHFITRAEKMYNVDKIVVNNKLAKATGCSKNALNKMTRMEETREKMKSRAVQRKLKEQIDFERKKEEIRKRVEEQQKLAANFSLNPTNESNEFVFRLDGEEKQEKSFIHPDILKEMEQPVNNGNDGENKKKKKKKTKK